MPSISARTEMMCDHDIRACSSPLQLHANSSRKMIAAYWSAQHRQVILARWSCNPSIRYAADAALRDALKVEGVDPMA
jgi:hypothetical protein